ncbi:hypothetical protein [Pseudomonas sp. 22 E 5]|nr:hypothetical protein [Pseudomonas sp. 22 E 5]
MNFVRIPKSPLTKPVAASRICPPYLTSRRLKYATPAAGNAMVNTTPITRSISNDTTNPAAISAISPGGNASNQIIAVRSIRNSAASSLASSIACSMTLGASVASCANLAASAPSCSTYFNGSSRIACTSLMLSHTSRIAAQLPASTPLPIALAVDCSQRGLKPDHSDRSHCSRSPVSPA